MVQNQWTPPSLYIKSGPSWSCFSGYIFHLPNLPCCAVYVSETRFYEGSFWNYLSNKMYIVQLFTNTKCSTLQVSNSGWICRWYQKAIFCAVSETDSFATPCTEQGVLWAWTILVKYSLAVSELDPSCLRSVNWVTEYLKGKSLLWANFIFHSRHISPPQI